MLNVNIFWMVTRLNYSECNCHKIIFMSSSTAFTCLNTGKILEIDNYILMVHY